METAAVQIFPRTRKLTPQQTAWIAYEIGNQAFTTSVVSVFFGPYLTELANATAVGGFVHPFGIPVRAGAVFAFAVSISVALQALLLPVLGAISDRSRAALRFLGIFASAGTVATAALSLIPDGGYLGAAALFIAANVCFGAAAVFYNGLLNAVAADSDRARVSSAGYGVGYAGGGIILALHIVAMASAEPLGVSENFAVRFCLLTSGLWWAGFTLRCLRGLRGISVPPGSQQKSGVSDAFRSIFRTARSLRRRPHTALFMAAYLLYSDGIQTVTAVASQFGYDELRLPVSFLSMTMLLIQFTAFGGSLLFGRIAAVFGEKRAVLLTLFVWNLVVVFAFGFLHDAAGFLAAGVVMATVLGGSQALSRSLFSRMIPPGRESEYFGFYAVSERGTSWLGPLLFGFALQFTGSYRLAILSLLVLFGAGMALFAAVKPDAAFREAENVENSDK